MTALAHERPETMPETRTESEPTPSPTPSVSELDEVLWQAWKAMELPEGYRAEIIEGAIEVSPTGRFPHARIVNRLRDALADFLRDSEHAAWNDTNVIHARRAWIPDGFVAPGDEELIATEDDLGVKASAVQLIVEIVSPGKRNQDRDRIKKRREYARAGIPVYVIIDDYDNRGTVSILTAPVPEHARYEDEHRVPYGTEVTIPEGPAKGFAITEAITGPARPGK
ncbi:MULTISPECIES: Uma2 family endonuclease [unclassified Streptomyces]|uniref:Uma2 family endonuclease n=1 Tax=unclassified Streptomyces TaxID=2593676 RepID=UPI003870282D